MPVVNLKQIKRPSVHSVLVVRQYGTESRQPDTIILQPAAGDDEKLSQEDFKWINDLVCWLCSTSRNVLRQFSHIFMSDLNSTYL